MQINLYLAVKQRVSREESSANAFRNVHLGEMKFSGADGGTMAGMIIYGVDSSEEIDVLALTVR